MGVLHFLILVSVGVILIEAFPVKPTTAISDSQAVPEKTSAVISDSPAFPEKTPAAISDNKSTVLKHEIDETAKADQEKAYSRIIRAANPQNHAVNYIRPDDRFPTVA